MVKDKFQDPIRPVPKRGSHVYYNFELWTVESLEDNRITELRSGTIIAGIGNDQPYLFAPLPEVIRISIVFQEYWSRLQPCSFINHRAVRSFLAERWRISILEYYLNNGRPGMRLEDLTGLDVEKMLRKLRAMAATTVEGIQIVNSPKPF